MAYALVVVGGSWGGMEATGRLLRRLPDGFATPLAVALHRHHDSSGPALVASLQAKTPLTVREVDDKDPIEPGGRVYLAPSDYHLLVERGHFALSLDERVQFSRPSIDVLFESAADAYGDQLIAVLLTGASADGAEGAVRVRRRGGVVLVQDPEEAERPTMPQAAIAAGAAQRALKVEAIADALVGLCGASQRGAA